MAVSNAGVTLTVVHGQGLCCRNRGTSLMNSLCIRLLTAASISLCAYPAFAQGGLGFLQDAPAGKLTKEDVDLLKAAAEQAVSGAPGVPKPWSNPATGNSGAITLLQSFNSADGRSCRRLRVETQAKATSGVYTTNVCRAEGGPWQIDTEARPPK
jgi:surface antigen